MKVLIATWGDPKNWYEVNYHYEGLKRSFKSALSLIREKDNPDKTIIIVSDTLINSVKDNESKKGSDFKIQSYVELKSKVEDYIVNFCENNLCRNDLRVVPDKVIVSYGFGEFNNFKFSGNAMDFYYGILKELSFLFSKLIKEVVDEKIKIEVIFDATHGINYTTILSYRALKEVLEILAYVFDVRLKVLNTDPHFRSEGKDITLNVNTIEHSNIAPRVLFYRSDNKKPIKPWSGIIEYLGKDTMEKIGAQVSEFLKKNFGNFADFERKISIFLGSFIFALPVFLISYIIPSDKIYDKLCKVFEEFENNIIFNPLENDPLRKTNIIRKLEFEPFFSNMSKSLLVSSILEKSGFRRLEDISLLDIINLKRKIFEKFPIESNRIDVEVDGISGWRAFKEYKRYSEIIGESKDGNPSKRNFFAHAGFEHNAIEVKDSSDEKKTNDNEKNLEGKFVRIYEPKRNLAEKLIIDNLPRI